MAKVVINKYNKMLVVESSISYISGCSLYSFLRFLVFENFGDKNGEWKGVQDGEHM